MEQLKLFSEKEPAKIITKEEIEEQKEKRRLSELCVDCKKDKREWDINIRDKCSDCLKKYFIEEFRKLGVGEKGFRVVDDNFIFYSHTTEKEEVSGKNILQIGSCIMGTDFFSKTIMICDEFGLHKNTFGITEEFKDYLVKELKLEEKEDEQFGTFWINPLIRQDEKGKKIFELKKSVEEQKRKIAIDLLEIDELE